MVIVPAFTYFFTFTGRDWGQNTVVNKLPPKLRKPCKQNQSSECYFYLFKTFSHLTGHLNISIAFYLSSDRLGWGLTYPGLGSLPPEGEDTLAWQLAPHLWKLGELRSEKLFNNF